jgi:hypothetical protein
MLDGNRAEVQRPSVSVALDLQPLMMPASLKV